MADRVVLVGMMGAGKSTVGRELAARLGWRFLDSDALVEASTGSTVAELFATRGEEVFRAEESRVLAEALQADGRWWCRPQVASCSRRPTAPSWRPPERWCGSGPSRPRWPPGSATGPVARCCGTTRRAVLVELDAVRRPLYEEVADVVVDVDDLDPSTVVDRILAATAFARSTP